MTRHAFKRKNNMVQVTATAAGQTGLFLVDSGSSKLALNKGRYPDLHGEPDTAHSLLGEVPQEHLEIEEFRWDDLVKTRVPARLLNLTHLEFALGEPLLGLISHDLLSEQPFRLDYQQKRLEFHPVLQPNPVAVLPFVVRSHLPILEVTGHGETLQIGLDTGANANMLGLEYAHLLPTFEYKGFVEGSNIQQPIQVGVIDGLSVGQVALRPMRTIVQTTEKLKKLEEAEIDGLFGCEFLMQFVTVWDFAAQTLTLESRVEE